MKFTTRFATEDDVEKAIKSLSGYIFKSFENK